MIKVMRSESFDLVFNCNGNQYLVYFIIRYPVTQIDSSFIQYQQPYSYNVCNRQMFLYICYILLPITFIYYITLGTGRNIDLFLVDSGLKIRNPHNVRLSSIPCPLKRKNRARMILGLENLRLSSSLQYLKLSLVSCQI